MDDFEYYFLQNEEESEQVKGAKLELHKLLKRNRERHSKINKPMKAASNVISLLGEKEDASKEDASKEDASKGGMEASSAPWSDGEKAPRTDMHPSARSREHYSKRRRSHKADTRLKTGEEEEVPREDHPVGDNSKEDHPHSEVNAERRIKPDDRLGEATLEGERKGKRRLNEDNISYHGKKPKRGAAMTRAIPTGLSSKGGESYTVGNDDDKGDTAMKWSATGGSPKRRSNSCSGISEGSDQSDSLSSGRSSSTDYLSHDRGEKRGKVKMERHPRGGKGEGSARLARSAKSAMSAKSAKSAMSAKSAKSAPRMADTATAATTASSLREERTSGSSRQGRVPEEPKRERKKYSGLMLLHKFKINYQNLTELEKKYYLYMMKKLHVRYDHERHIFYTDDAFTKCFTEKVRQEKGNFNYLGYLEYACYYILEWLTPTREEKLLKQKSLVKLEVAVKSLFPKATMQPFGSFVTGLSIPGSDLDVCFLDIPLEDLDALLMISYTLVKLEIVADIRIIKDARVKILKYTDKETGVQVDVCTNQVSSKQTTDFIKSKVEKYLYLRPLVILLKFFLNTRNLNETYIGGIGSFLLCCMVTHFLQLHPSTFDWNVFSNSYLVKLLLEFFSFYSIDYNVDFNCSVLRGLGHVMPRYMRREFEGSNRLCFENPVDTSVDIGKNAYKISHQFCALASLVGGLRGQAGEALLDVHSSCGGGDGKAACEAGEKQGDEAVDRRGRYAEDEAGEEQGNEAVDRLGRYAEGDKLNAAGSMFPLFFANFFNPDSIVFTKRLKADFPNPQWNISHFDFSVTTEEKHKLLEMLRDDWAVYFDQGIPPDSAALFAAFDRAFPFSLDLYNNAFRYA
ncbi:hypothetical protein PCYB_123030 [Plasmodium cynomolgi strain B]|uniref:Poly(A) RNA polymerase mitochondrial-like central palm domain-containing protein n=1 Tax=Plasmodium cynomolgi (strain B) TaxID=1120755 RepID=K6VEP8_PLACD|nr:hypothetical protein PCYB_123030 [Plasmodium cynomolgi strain B]GAB67737.1 hypothetical protein PCYB_123030 [Plasmodium cynomolgi strain B]